MPSKNVAHQLFVHITWCTEGRVGFLHDDTEKSIKAIIADVCKEMEYEIIALETVPDHVHLLVRFHPMHQLAQLVKSIKGRSSRLLARNTGAFKWQEGYGINTVGVKALDDAIQYILNQKKHHSTKDENTT